MKSGVTRDVDDDADASGRGDQWVLFIDLPVLEAVTAVFSTVSCSDAATR
jgi:hypothetical protein